MKLKIPFALAILTTCIIPFAVFSQTIAEKKASLLESGGDLSAETEKFLQQINHELNETRDEEKKLTEQAFELYQQNAPEESYKPLIHRINELRTYIATLQESWREMIVRQGKQDGYALWYQPETTLEQLILDYGSQEYVYLMKPEIGAIKISVDSNLPIPRASWNEMLDLILAQNGIGMRELNPFLKELYVLRDDRSAIRLITNKREDIEILSPDTRIAFVLTPEPSDVRRVWFFLDNFANHDSTVVQLVGRDIMLIAPVSSVRDLLRLYDFISLNRGEKEYKAVTLTKVTAEDMARVLMSIFHQAEMGGGKTMKLPLPGGGAPGGPPGGPSGESFASRTRDIFAPGPEANGLQVFPLSSLSQGLFLIGTKEEIRKAEEVIREVESQVGGSREKVVYWYTLKHSDPEEVAEVLSKVYQLMVTTGAGYEFMNGGNGGDNRATAAIGSVEQRTVVERGPDLRDYLPPLLYPTDPYFQQPVPPVASAYIFPANSHTDKPQIDMGNFIIDLKTGSIIMVVEQDLLPKIKDLIRRMDVPKKMVQLEVLLFEKKIAKQNNFGLNLLRLGCAAKNETCASAIFNAPTATGFATGIFDFLWSHERTCGIPAFDLSYRFLLSQEDVTINASPSVLTVNQTPAFIAIAEEISINTGIVQLETAGGVTLKDAYQRAQYGIILKITPTIHPGDDEEGIDTISLDSDITFDTFDTLTTANDDRPNVTRRNIKNQTRVADGETVIIGGLRRKNTEDAKDSIPFIGEIPGFGKLFSETFLRDSSTEMFIFITPKIVSDPACDLEWIRQEEMIRRPGDIPEFMSLLVEAEEREKNQLFDGWLTTLFGRERDCLYTPGWQNPDTCGTSQGEYDGR